MLKQIEDVVIRVSRHGSLEDTEDGMMIRRGSSGVISTVDPMATEERCSNAQEL